MFPLSIPTITLKFPIQQYFQKIQIPHHLSKYQSQNNSSNLSYELKPDQINAACYLTYTLMKHTSSLAAGELEILFHGIHE